MDERQLFHANNIVDAQKRIAPLFHCLMNTKALCRLSVYNDNADNDNIKHHHVSHLPEEDLNTIMVILRKNVNEQVDFLAQTLKEI